MAPLLKSAPGLVSDQTHMVEVIHPGAAEIAVGNRKACRLNNMSFDIQAGAEPENRPRILRNVRLEKGYAHAMQTAFLKGPPGEKVTVPKGFVICQWCIAIVGLRCLGKGVNRTILSCPVPALAGTAAHPIRRMGLRRRLLLS
jgi:hypothetical protein